MTVFVKLVTEDSHGAVTMESLRQAVSLETGEEEELGAVKRALQEARKKLKAALRERLFGEGGER